MELRKLRVMPPTPAAAEKEMELHSNGDGEKIPAPAPAVDAPPPELVKHIDEKILKHSHDADAAMKAFEGYEGQTLELSEETNRRLLRKIDLHLMPVSLACVSLVGDVYVLHCIMGQGEFNCTVGVEEYGWKHVVWECTDVCCRFFALYTASITSTKQH